MSKDVDQVTTYPSGRANQPAAGNGWAVDASSARPSTLRWVSRPLAMTAVVEGVAATHSTEVRSSGSVAVRFIALVMTCDMLDVQLVAGSL